MFQFERIYELPLPDIIGPNYSPDALLTATSEKVAAFRKKLYENPEVATYLTSIAYPDLNNNYFPNLIIGHYMTKDPHSGEILPEREPGPRVKNLLEYFGAPNAEAFLHRGKRFAQIMFAGKPQLARTLETAFDCMVYFQGENKRRSGEEAWCHDIRVGIGQMNALVGRVKRRHFFQQTNRGEFLPLTLYVEGREELCLAACVSAVLHDLTEDFVQDGNATISVRGNKQQRLVVTPQRSFIKERGIEERSFDLQFGTYAIRQSTQDMIKAYTNLKYKDKGTSKNFERFAQSISAIRARDEATKNALLYNMAGTKIDIDRFGNLSIYYGDTRSDAGKRYFDKLEETYKLYSEFGLFTFEQEYFPLANSLTLLFDDYAPPDAPHTPTLALLKLLGATNEELFGWILDLPPDHQVNFLLEPYRYLGYEFLIIPGVHRADIIALHPTEPEGFHVEVYRNGDVRFSEIRPTSRAPTSPFDI